MSKLDGSSPFPRYSGLQTLELPLASDQNNSLTELEGNSGTEPWGTPPIILAKGWDLGSWCFKHHLQSPSRQWLQNVGPGRTKISEKGLMVRDVKM